MLCQKCKAQNATSHIHFVLNGVVRDAYLCHDCAKEYHASELYENDVFKMLSSLLNDNVGNVKETLKCECCGTDFDEIRRTGRVGCGNCYTVFEKRLAPTIARIHGKTVHIGKKPDITLSEPASQNVPTVEETKESKIAKLRYELAEAIRNEEYEKAAVIRDKIREEEA